MKKIKMIVRKIIIRVLWYFPPKIAHKILYKMTLKEDLNIDSPETLNEKIQYMIVNKMIGKKEAECTDKFLMRNYVTKFGYEENLPKLYATYKNAKEIDIDKLPEKFVLKANNGAGDVLICRDKKEFAKVPFKKILNKNLKKNYARVLLEYHYKYIKPLIICEEYLDDGTGKAPIDYKIFCFEGKAKYIFVCVDRENDAKKIYYDLDWNYLEDFSEYKYKKIDKPDNLEKMIEMAEKLASEFKAVRVDLYNIKGKIYIGELTFTTGAGMLSYLTSKGQKMLGKEIKL